MGNKETPEEASERLYPIKNTGSMFMPSRDEVNNSYKQEGFIEGVKWQQERTFTTEEMDFIKRCIESHWELWNQTHEDNQKDWVISQNILNNEAAGENDSDTGFGDPFRG
jgi:predicted KAP-like P-loop ATPase